jgi:hypothetical protein
MYNDLLQQEHPHLIGTIKVVFDTENDQMRVIDGQHRIESLQMFFDTKSIQDVDLILEVYHVDDINSPDVHMLYKKANANLNVSVEDDVNVHLSEIVNALSKDTRLSKGIIDKNNGRINKPRISKKEIFEAFKEHMRAQDMSMSVDDVVSRVVAINKQLKAKTNLEMFGRNHPAEKHRINKAKAENYEFYLNLNGKYPPERWIPLIGNGNVAI